jgi:hypothetical protein
MNRAAVPTAFYKLCLIVLLQISPASLGGAVAAEAPDPFSLYGKEMAFDVFRDGKKVGQHTMLFSRSAVRDVSVTARFELKITFLTIPFYEFLYRSSAVWRDGHLKTIKAVTDEDGNTSTVQAFTKGGGLSIKGPKGPMQWDGTLYPTNHWNIRVLSQKHVLNTLTGEISRVTIASEGRERIRAEGAWVQATRYQYSGDIDTTVWYDDQGRWVKMRFPAKDGSVIDYQCTRCGLGKADQAATN